jgi:hypothetical protein
LIEGDPQKDALLSWQARMHAPDEPRQQSHLIGMVVA